MIAKLDEREPWLAVGVKSKIRGIAKWVLYLLYSALPDSSLIEAVSVQGAL